MKEPDGSVEGKVRIFLVRFFNFFFDFFKNLFEKDGFVSTATTLIRQFDELLQRQAAEVKQRQETIVEVSFIFLTFLTVFRRNSSAR